MRALAFLLALLTQVVVLPAEQPNFIVIFTDNLGYGDIEPFGSTLHRTPHLRRMAAQGRKMTHFYVTAGVCAPSRASIMTGSYSQRIGLHDNPRDSQVLRPLSPYGMHPDEVTIAEVLKPLGYATAIIGKWHLGDQTPFLPTRQGFDLFFGVPYSDDMTQAVGQRIGDRLDGKAWPPLPLMLNEQVVEAPPDRNELTRRYTERALEFIEDNADGPFFLYMPQAMPGSTREPFSSAAFRGKSRNGKWGDSIEELDWSAGEILDKLVELGIDDNTLVIWTSDNGAPLAEDIDSPSRGSNKPLHGRGYTTAEGAFRVPTIVWQPGAVPAGSVCAEMATTMDLLPTFARLAGGSPPDDRVLDGHDIRPILFEETCPATPYDALYYHERDQLQAVRSGEWKLFVPLEQFDRHPHFEPGEGDKPLLFNVAVDIGSVQNLADERPEVVKRLMAIAEQARQDLGDRGRPGSRLRPRGRTERVKAQVLE